MVFDNLDKELDKADRSLAVFEKARELAMKESREILDECRKSIARCHRANNNISGNHILLEDHRLLKDAQEKAYKAARLLKKLER